MTGAGCSAAQVGHFKRNFHRFAGGESPLVPESDIEPVPSLPRLEDLPNAPDAPLSRVVVIKLNGGLGTSMGLSRPKGLLKVRDGLSFVDIVARQILSLRERRGANIPLLLMNSFNTSAQTLEALSAYELDQPVPLEFLQSKVPKITADLQPASCPEDPRHEWCPPGHGDIYPSLRHSSLLKRLLEQGIHYAFISNIDNLGAILDPSILSWFAHQRLPFMMEVTRRTSADRKGGHLARRKRDGRLLLREIAQCPPEDRARFQDIDRHRFFNTNNLWLDLRALAEADELALPLIVNRKRLKPQDPRSPEVVQLESAMGAAISVLEGAAALHVPRKRFAPVKTTSDLLVVRSDAYRLEDDFHMTLVPGRKSPPAVELDQAHYKLVPDFEQRFPFGSPSMQHCEALQVEGSVRFGRDIQVKGRTRVVGPSHGTVHLDDGSVIEGDVKLN